MVVNVTSQTPHTQKRATIGPLVQVPLQRAQMHAHQTHKVDIKAQATFRAQSSNLVWHTFIRGTPKGKMKNESKGISTSISAEAQTLCGLRVTRFIEFNWQRHDRRSSEGKRAKA